jgi:hypothetical protein
LKKRSCANRNKKTNLEKLIQSKKEEPVKMDLEKELELLEQEITPKKQVTCKE